jgi:hypothetical protein
MVLWQRRMGTGSPITAPELRDVLIAAQSEVSLPVLKKTLQRLRESGLVRVSPAASPTSQTGRPPVGYRVDTSDLIGSRTAAAIALELHGFPERPVEQRRFIEHVAGLGLDAGPDHEALGQDEIEEKLELLVKMGYVSRDLRESSRVLLLPGKRMAEEKPFLELLAEKVGEEARGEATAQQIDITFDSTLSPEQITGFLNALADYYRACGGAGLAIDFELQELIVQEPVDVVA